MARSVGQMIFSQSLNDLWKSRFRRRDLRIIIPLGVAYALAHVALLQAARQWFGLPPVAEGFLGNALRIAFTIVIFLHNLLPHHSLHLHVE